MLKKGLICVLFVFLLSGCASVGDLETVSDVYQGQTPAAGEIRLSLPGDAGEEAVCAEQDGKLYICDDYVITVQTLPGGDLKRTLQTVTGFPADSLTVVETQRDGLDSYQTVWTAAGEGGDQLGRAEILSDGSFHYVLTVMADASAAGGLTDAWQTLFDSFAVSRTAS